MSIVDGPMHFSGDVTFGGQVAIPTGTITDARVAVGAAIAATKCIQRQRTCWCQDKSDITVVTKNQVIHTVMAAGTLQGIKIGCVVANIGAASITVDLKKNGATVLSAVMTYGVLAAYALVTGTIATPAIVAGDVLEAVVVATAGGGTLAKGLFGVLLIDEAPV